MKKLQFFLLFGFLFGVLLLVVSAPLNPSFAVGDGANCTAPTTGGQGNCDSGLTCSIETARCARGLCPGTCVKAGIAAGQACPSPNADPGGCDSGLKCGADSVCVPKTCDKNLTGHRDCPGGFVCKVTTSPCSGGRGTCSDGGVCSRQDNGVAKSGDACPASGNCGTDLTCKNNVCVPTTCKTNGAVCPGGFNCLAGKQVCGMSKLPCTCEPTISCTCTTPGVKGKGKNGYHCTIPGENPVNAACKEDNQSCYNDAAATFSRDDVFDGKLAQGVSCRAVDDKKAIPLPPSPPCVSFVNGGCTSVATAFGDLKTDSVGFITTTFGVLFALVGGIGLLLFMRASYRIMTSQGKPEALQQGREEVIAVIVGLLFIIFSSVLLEVIGVDILRIPGATPAGKTNPATAATCADAGGACSNGQACRGTGGVAQGQKDCAAGTLCCVPQ